MSAMDRREFGAAVSAVVGSSLLVPGAAVAVSGVGPKVSIFGDSSSTPYTLTEDLYSPYSPFPAEGNGVYSKFNDAVVLTHRIVPP